MRRLRPHRLSLPPWVIDPQAGAVRAQSLALGAKQIAISVSVNALIALSAALADERRLDALAVKMAAESRR